ncbi:glutathione S-transferase tcpG [Chaetomidium leptoderma]|uniref:glutathione transferase n=1 Tax=Chaetomidium leptoderma TaxID=669021 RepID=A0AAN6VMG3_9PEZI|nr:glutathione S-transferase tcpG [Chaetomidium leptoderma]
MDNTKQNVDWSKHPEVATDRLVLYVRKALPAPTMNSLKPLMLIEALSIPHSIHLIQSLQEETWLHDVNPFKLLPAMEDVELCNTGDGTTQRRLNVFDSSACLLYMADKYDTDRTWLGRGLAERTVVMSWTVAYAAGLGATGEWWLKMRKPPANPDALARILDSIRVEYDVLEKRLGEPGQRFVALPDRATVADLAFMPLANAKIAAAGGIDISQWPRLKDWSERIAAIPAVEKAIWRNERLGLSRDEIVAQGLPLGDDE